MRGERADGGGGPEQRWQETVAPPHVQAALHQQDPHTHPRLDVHLRRILQVSSVNVHEKYLSTLPLLLFSNPCAVKIGFCKIVGECIVSQIKNVLH